MPIKDTQSKINFEEQEIEVFEMNKQANPFASNKALAFAYRRAERIALGTQLVANSIPDTHAIKSRIESALHELLLDIMHARSGLHAKESAALASIIAKIRILLSFLDTAHIGGHLSLGNVQVLKHAYLDFISFLVRSIEAGASEPHALSHEDFLATDKRQLESHKGHLKDKQEDAKKVDEKDTSVVPEETKKEKRDVSLAHKRVIGNRRVAIIDALTTGGHLSLADIAEAVPGVGQKTLQRELNKLIDDGVVAREGERRWSTYALVME